MVTFDDHLSVRAWAGWAALRALFRQDTWSRSVRANEQGQVERPNMRKFDKDGVPDGLVRRADLPWDLTEEQRGRGIGRLAVGLGVPAGRTALGLD